MICSSKLYVATSCVLGHVFSKELTNLQPPLTAIASSHHTTHSIEIEGLMKVRVAVALVPTTQPTSKRRPVPDQQKTLNIQCPKTHGP